MWNILFLTIYVCCFVFPIYLFFYKNTEPFTVTPDPELMAIDAPKSVLEEYSENDIDAVDSAIADSLESMDTMEMIPTDVQLMDLNITTTTIPDDEEQEPVVYTGTLNVNETIDKTVSTISGEIMEVMDNLSFIHDNINPMMHAEHTLAYETESYRIIPSVTTIDE